MMQRTHKVRLYPNNRQETYLMRCCGAARFAYNWGLGRWSEMYEAYKADPESCPQPNQYVIRKELNTIKRDEFPWMLEVTKYAPQQAIINLGKAFDAFFKGRGRYPRFKRKGTHDSFYVGSDQLRIDGKSVWIPGLMRFMGGIRKLGWIRTAEALRYRNARVLCAVVSKTADKWFIAITCELPDRQECGDGDRVVGVDVGVGEYVTSDGEVHVVPRPHRKAQKKLRRAQQSLSRKRKGSKNRTRQKAKVARIHNRVANIRSDWMHKLTSDLVDRYDIIAIEDLNVSGMAKNHHLAMSVSDAAFGEFRRQIEYKSDSSGRTFFIADRWYPSSKTCSNCGSVKAKLSLSERTYVCDECGFTCHRDLNAAINLKNLAVSSTVTACGEFSASACRHQPERKQPLRSRKKASVRPFGQD